MNHEERPLRLAYVRLHQATILIHIEQSLDPDLGGSARHLESILKDIDGARHSIERLAAAENILLINEDD